MNFEMVMEVTRLNIHEVQDLPMIEYFNYLAFGIDKRRLENKKREELRKKHERNVKRYKKR